MFKRGRSLASVTFVYGVVAVVACVNDPTTNPGDLDGPCYTDGTCNSGLVCSNSKCVGPNGNDGSTNDGNANDGTANDSAADSGPRVCTFQPTQFPCTGQSAAPACYGQAQSCELTGCPGGPSDVVWNCFSPNQCGNTPCCVAPTVGALTPTTDCSLGGLKVLTVDGGAGNLVASVCASGIACGATDSGASNITLCQLNTQCPTGSVCSPVKISGSGASANNVIIGACVPE